MARIEKSEAEVEALLLDKNLNQMNEGDLGANLLMRAKI